MGALKLDIQAVRDGETGVITATFNDSNLTVAHNKYTSGSNTNKTDNDLNTLSLTPDNITNKERAINLIRDEQPEKALEIVRKTFEDAKAPKKISEDTQDAMDIHDKLIEAGYSQEAIDLIYDMIDDLGGASLASETYRIGGVTVPKGAAYEGFVDNTNSSKTIERVAPAKTAALDLKPPGTL